MNFRAQASIEFLSTYAWALLGLIIAIAALSLLGVFDVDSYKTDSCQSGSQIVCQDYYLGLDEDDDALLLLKFKNAYEKEIVIEQVNVDGFSQVSQEEVRILPGSTITVSLYSSEPIFETANKESLPFTLTFHRYESENSYSVDGSLTVTTSEDDIMVTTQDDESFVMGEPYCGDGKVQAYLNEECDPPTQIDSQETNSNHCGGLHVCLSDCTCQGVCGDGEVTGAEECEINSDCDSTSYCQGCRCYTTPNTGGDTPSILIQ